MLFDRENCFSYRQALTATGGSQDQVYLGPKTWAGNANGATEFPVALALNTPFTGTATGLTIQVRSSNNSDMSSPRLHQSVTLTAAELAGTSPMPSSLTVPEQSLPYVDLLYTAVGGTLVGGVITAGIVFARQSNR